MARSLSSSGLSTFLVPDSSIYAIMSRVNKVILGAHAILANGGMFAITGSLLAATAARAHSTPVVVCAGQFKLTPQWNLYHEYGALDFADPSNVLGFEEGNLVEKVEVVNPYYDYVNPELLDVYITNEWILPFYSASDFILTRSTSSGDHPPSSFYRYSICVSRHQGFYWRTICRLIKETYDDDDTELWYLICIPDYKTCPSSV